MHLVVLIEDDPLVRDVVREYLEREGYAVAGVSSVRGALDLLRWRRVSLVLLDFACAAGAETDELSRLRRHGTPVVMLSSAPRGVAVSNHGAIDTVTWSPIDPATLVAAVRRCLPPARAAGRPATPPGDSRGEFVPSSSGTFRATRPSPPHAGSELSTLPAPPDDAAVPSLEQSLEALGRLVLDATNGKRR